MKLPSMVATNTSRSMVSVFMGYNHNLRISDGEFFDMKNLTSDNYPILSPRKTRGEYGCTVSDNGTRSYAYTNPLALISKDELCYVDGSSFVIGTQKVSLGLSTAASMLPKTLISMGAFVIIMPDKKWINTQTKAYGDINASFARTASSTNKITFKKCDVDGNESDNGNYVKIETSGIGSSFAAGDGVTITGITDASLSDLNSTLILHARGNDFIVVSGVIDSTVEQTSGTMYVKRQMPDMDFVIESGNRLWGCKYGKDAQGNMLNEIYASKLGDFKNWNCFAGLSTDSYVASVGSDGQFTGAIAHLGYPLFFKENCMHKVYGTYPANYQIQTATCRGVQRGCGGSLAIVNEVLYYKSVNAVCAYDGSLPQEMSYPLGEIGYGSAVACGYGNKYYISMLKNGTTDSWTLFVYDALKQLWHKEDETRMIACCSHGGEMYFIDNKDQKIKTVSGSGIAESGKVRWTAESGIIGLESPDKKYISKLDVRMSLGIGSRVVFYVQYDSNNQWEVVFRMSGTNLGSFTVPIKAKRCDHMRFRFEGTGDCKIFSITKTVEQGSGE